MRFDHRNETLALYLGYFVTLAFGLIPSISYYAIGVLVLQAFYALIRYTGSTEPVFRSHLFNYLLGVGGSFIVVFILALQTQAFGFEFLKALTGAFSGIGYRYDSAVPAAYVIFMMVVETLFAIFWPIVLIARGLYNLNTGVPIFAGFRKAMATPFGEKTIAINPESANKMSGGSGFLLSAIMDNGQVVRFPVPNASSKVIGRHTESDMLLDDPTVSRKHAMIEVRDGLAFVKDLDSLSGTFIGDRKVGFNPVQIYPSDTIQIGAIKVKVSAL